MNEHELLDLVKSLREVIGPAMGRSPALRKAVGLIGQFLIEEAEKSGQVEGGGGKAEGVGEGVVASAAIAREDASLVVAPIVAKEPGTRGIVSLKIGDVTVPVTVRGTTEEIGRARAAAHESVVDDREPEEEIHELDLALIEARCLLKARSCELFVERRAAAGDEERSRANYEEIGDVLRRAKATRECFLWVLWREREQPAEDVVARIAVCYRALGATVALMRRVDDAGERAGEGFAAEAMQLMAEAGSALRVALHETWLTAADRDQDDSHLWLRRETAWRQIFLQRFMVLSDPGDPARAEGIVADAAEVGERLAKRIASAKGVDSALSKVKYHAQKAAGGDADHFVKIAEAIESLRAMGVSGGDRRVREALPMAVASAMPVALLERLAVREAVDAALRKTDSDDGPRERAWSARVAEARSLLEGRALVMVGGEPRKDAIDRLARAFGVSRVDWVHLSEHGSSDGLRAPINREDAAAVLVLIKLTGHLHAEEAQRYARAAGKPWVYLTAGYNPEQVAEALLQQAGERLRERGGVKASA